MKQSVSDASLMNIPQFRVIDPEKLIGQMFISHRRQIFVKRNDITHQVPFEFLHVFSLPLAFHEFSPSFEQILERDDIIVSMIELDPSQTMKAPPPMDFAGHAQDQRGLFVVAWVL